MADIGRTNRVLTSVPKLNEVHMVIGGLCKVYGYGNQVFRIEKLGKKKGQLVVKELTPMCSKDGSLVEYDEELFTESVDDFTQDILYPTAVVDNPNMLEPYSIDYFSNMGIHLIEAVYDLHEHVENGNFQRDTYDTDKLLHKAEHYSNRGLI